jgi:hypothetical protein
MSTKIHGNSNLEAIKLVSAVIKALPQQMWI